MTPGAASDFRALTAPRRQGVLIGPDLLTSHHMESLEYCCKAAFTAPVGT